MTLVLKTFGTALVVGLAGTFGAFASTIDLTDAGSYSFSSTSATGVVDGVTWDITPVTVPTAGQGVLTNDQLYNGSKLPTYPANAPTLALENDGIGIYSTYDTVGDTDEVSYPHEWLDMSFTGTVSVTGIYVLDIYGLETVNVLDQSGDSVCTISAIDPANSSKGGYGYCQLSTAVDVTSLSFMPGPVNDTVKGNGKPDFSLAALTLTVAPVPLPAAGLLLLGGLGALGAAKRRRRQPV